MINFLSIRSVKVRRFLVVVFFLFLPFILLKSMIDVLIEEWWKRLDIIGEFKQAWNSRTLHVNCYVCRGRLSTTLDDTRKPEEIVCNHCRHNNG